MPSIKEQAKELKKEGLGGMSRQMREMIAYWKEHRPMMYKELKARGELQDFALVLDLKVTDQMQKGVSRGISLSDGQRMNAGGLLMTPESEDGETTTKQPSETQPKQTRKKTGKKKGKKTKPATKRTDKSRKPQKSPAETQSEQTKTQQMREAFDATKEIDAAGRTVAPLWTFQQEMVKKTGSRATDGEIEELHKIGLRLRPVSHPANFEEWQRKYFIKGMNETLGCLVDQTQAATSEQRTVSAEQVDERKALRNEMRRQMAKKFGKKGEKAKRKSTSTPKAKPKASTSTPEDVANAAKDRTDKSRERLDAAKAAIHAKINAIRDPNRLNANPWADTEWIGLIAEYAGAQMELGVNKFREFVVSFREDFGTENARDLAPGAGGVVESLA